MGNVVDLSQVRNHPSRSAFPLESHRPFTAKAGMLLPVYWKFCYPGDSWQLSHRHFTRTQPVNTAAFGRFREYFDWYFVPIRLLNRSLGQALTQILDNPVQSQDLLTPRAVTPDLPHVPLSWMSFFLSWQCGFSLNNSQEPVLNFFGFPAASDTFRLFRHLGYGNVLASDDSSDFLSKIGYTSVPNYTSFVRGVDLNVNILPFLTYQKIYNDHFRFAQWEKSQPVTWNVDYYTGGNILSPLSGSNSEALVNRQNFVQGNNFFTLRYANWNKDRFMGVLPNSQLGIVSSLNVNVGVANSQDLLNVVWRKQNTISSELPNVVAKTSKNSLPNQYDVDLSITQSGTPPSSEIGQLYASAGTVYSNFNVLQLRLAEALQRYREISMCHDSDYVSQLQAHWDVKLSKSLSDICIHIGGSASNLSISEVENTALGDSAALLKGKGVGSGQSSNKFSFSEHGVLMCIYHCVPLIDYRPLGVDSFLKITNVSDVPQPEFDRIGLETQPWFEFANIFTDNYLGKDTLTKPMGYLPRYYSLKTEVDYIFGAFETTLKDWVVTLDPLYLSDWIKTSVREGVLNYAFFKVNPSVVDSIFAVKADSTVDTDEFLVDCFIDVKRVSNFDFDGMPY